jgi:hypothetical protein
MSSMALEEGRAAYDALDAALDKIAALDCDALSTAELMELAERNHTAQCRVPALIHELVNELAATATVAELGGPLAHALADRLRIKRSEARRRIAEAADLGPRRALTGEPLPPKLEATAAGQRAGLIDGEHIKIIRTFFDRLPHFIDEPTKVDAERKLAAVASAYRPDELQRFADWYDGVLNPDGTFTDEDRARRRGVSIGPQGTDGMSSPVSSRGVLTPL